MAQDGFITDVDGIRIGHFTDPRRPTGCTVILCEEGAVTGVDVRGSAPGTRETDLLDPINTVEKAHAILLAGGSAFGLDAAGGVMRYLEERGIGFSVAKVGGPSDRPSREAGVAGVPSEGRTVGPTSIKVGGPSDRPSKEAGVGSAKRDEQKAGVPSEGRTVGPTFIKVPIVPAAILFDLGLGDPAIRPTADSGYEACVNARTGPIEEGSFGAGAGATIGKIGLGRPMKGGLGTSSISLPNGIVVGAIVAVNCMGNIIDPKTGKIIAGARSEDGKSFVDAIDWFRAGHGMAAQPGANTTIGVVATNAAFTKAQMKKIAEMAHDGIARAINPAHTPMDGDTLFAMATGMSPVTTDIGSIGSLAAEAVAEAILRGIMRAKGVAGYPSYGDIQEP